MTSGIHDLRLVRQLERSIQLAPIKRATGLSMAEVEARIMRQRRDRKFTREHTVVPLKEPSDADKAAMTSMDMCWRCRKSLGSRQFVAWMRSAYGDGYIVTHGGC